MIADLYRPLENHFNNSLAFSALRIAVLIVGLYLLSFLAICFVILVYRKVKRDRCSNVPATASAMLAATFFWPASAMILLILFGYPAKMDRVELRDVVDLFRLWWGIMLFFTPISTVMGGLLLILYLTRKKQMSPRTIYISVSSIMFLQCVYVNAFLFVLGSK